MTLPPWAVDAGERAAKTFAQAFLAVAGVSGVVNDWHSVPWVHAAQAGVVAVILSLLMSVASLKVGTSGTASLTQVVEPAKVPAKRTRRRKTA